MSTFSWVLLGIGLFIFGQFMMMRPSVRERTLMQLREAARHMGLQPRLVVPPAWMRRESRQLVACYTLIVPGGGMPYWRAESSDGVMKTVTPGLDRLAGVVAPPAASRLLGLEAQANAICFYWMEDGGEPELEELKAFLGQLSRV